MLSPNTSPQQGSTAGNMRKAAFTLIELLVVIAIIAILAALLVPTLAKAKEQGQRANCIGNLRQLGVCWQMYADDYKGVFAPNNWIYTITVTDFTGSTSWCNGNALVDTNTLNLQQGLLYPYNRSVGIYHCPSDKSVVVNAGGKPTAFQRVRSYNMSQSVNGLGFVVNPQSGYPVDTTQPCFSKFSQVTNPPVSKLFVFLDESEQTLEDDQFGYPMINYGYGDWWDMPSNRHDQGADFSFADGHVEYWHWRTPMLTTIPEGSGVVPVTTAMMKDYVRVGSAMRQKPVDGLPD